MSERAGRAERTGGLSSNGVELPDQRRGNPSASNGAQNQALNAEWDQRLSQVSDKLRDLGGKIRGYQPSAAPSPAT